MRPFKSLVMRKASTLFTSTSGATNAAAPKAKPRLPKTALLKKPQEQDAIALLKADHKLMHGLFREYEKSRSATKKKLLVERICNELTIHARLEEEIFYPVVKKALKDKVLIPEATVEHDTLRFLLNQVEGVETIDEMFNARIKVLAEYVEHHVKEEHNELFPQASATRVDMLKLGRKLTARKAELIAGKGQP